MPVGHPGEGRHQGGDVLARLEGAHEQEVRATAGQPGVERGQDGGVGSRLGLVGPEPAGVDAVGGHEDLGVDPAPPGQLVGGDLARADHRRGPAGGHGDGPAEQEHLGPLVPLRAARRS